MAKSAAKSESKPKAKTPVLKYKLIKEKGTDLFRIVSLRQISGVCSRAGILGGLVSGPENLSQDGNCWISYGAKVTENASVQGSAFIDHQAQVSGNATVMDYARLRDHAKVMGNVVIKDHAYVWDQAVVSGNAILDDDCECGGNSEVSGNVYIGGNALVTGGSKVSGSVVLTDHVVVESATVSGDVELTGVTRTPTGSVITKQKQIMTMQGFKYPVSITHEGLISMGCKSGNLKWFRDNAKAMARYYDYSAKEVRAVRAAVAMMLAAVGRFRA